MIATIAVAGIVFGTLESVMRSREREKTRREVAAYIAEGVMTPEQAERVLRAGRKKDRTA